MPYTSPSGDNIALALGLSYLPPSGSAIPFAFADTTVSSSGALVVHEGGVPDEASMVGSVVTISRGVLAALETGADVALITEKEYTRGSLAVTEPLPDSAEIHGTVRVLGLFAAKEEAQDTFSALISVPVSGAMNSTEEGGGDTAALLAKAPAKGVFATTESPPAEGIAISGKSLLHGSFSVLESGIDLAFVLGKAPVDFERALWGDLAVSCAEESVLAEVAPGIYEVAFDMNVSAIEVE